MNDLLGREQNSRIAQDLLTANSIFALLNCSFADQIDLPTEQIRKFSFHLYMVEEAPLCISGEGDQHVYVTRCTKILAQNRTKER